jgi:hypothetical protein
MWSFKKRPRRQSRKSRDKLQRRLRFEALEARQLLAFSVALLDDLGNPDPNGNHVQFTGDGGLELSLQGSFLRHDLPLGSGIESPIDLDPAPGVQSRTVGAITGLTVDGTGSNDSFEMATGMSFSSVAAGKAVSISAETVSLKGPLSTGGGDFTSTGGNFTAVTTLSNIATWGGQITLNHTGIVTLNGNVNGGSFTLASGSQRAASLITGGGKTITATAGDISVYTTGDINLRGDISVSNGGNGAINLDSTGGNVSVRRIQTDGGDFVSTGGNFTAAAPTSSIVTWGGHVALNHTGIVTLNGNVTGGSFALASGSQRAASLITGDGKTITATAGDISVYTTGDINLRGDTWASNGGSAKVTLDSLSGNVSVRRIQTDGGDFTSVGGNFTAVTTQSNIVTWGGHVALDHTGVVTLNGVVNGGSFTLASGSQRAASLLTGDGKTITATAGDISVYTTGDINLRGDIRASSGGSAKVTLDSLSGNVSVRRIQTDGGDFTSAGGNFSAVTTQSNIVTWGGHVTLDHTGVVTLNGVVNGGSFTLASGSQRAVSLITGDGKTITATAGDISVYTTGDINLRGDISASRSGVASANVTLDSLGGNVSVRRIQTDGGDFSSAGGDFSAVTTQSNIVTWGGGVALHHTGVVTLNGVVNGGSFTLASGSQRAASLITGDGKTITATAGDISVYTTGDINLRGDISVSNGGNGAINLDSSGGSVFVRRLVTDGGNVVSSGVNFTSVTVNSNIVPSGGEVWLNHTGAVVLNGRVTASGLNSSGTTFETKFASNLTISGTITLDHFGAVSFGGQVNASFTDVLQDVATDFESTSRLFVDLTKTMPVFRTAGDLTFRLGSVVFIDAQGVEVGDPPPSEYLAAEGKTVTIEGTSPYVGFLEYTNDLSGDELVFLADVVPGEFLRLRGWVKGPLIAACAGACTLSINGSDPDFGPLVELRDANGNLVTAPGLVQGSNPQALGLTTFIQIAGAVNSSDSLTIDYKNGNPLFYNGSSVPVSYDGLGGTGTDTLALVDSTATTVIDNVTSNPIDANSGTLDVVVNGELSTIAYLGLEPITIGMPISTATFNLTNAADNAAVDYVNASTTRIRSTSVPPTFEQVTFATPSTSLTINGDDQADTVAFSGPLFNLPGTALSVTAKAASFGGTLQTNGGAFSAAGGSLTVANNVNTGSGLVSIASTQAVSIEGGVTSGILTATNAGSFAVGTNISTSGAIDIRAIGDITVAGSAGISANVSPGLSITLIADKDNDGTGDVKISNSTAAISTNGGTVTIGGQDFALGASLNAGSGTVTIDSAKAINIGDVISGALTATNAGSFAVGGNISASGAIDIRATGDITVAGTGGIVANASPGLSITLVADKDNDGTGDVKMSNSTAAISTNGGTVTIGGQDFSLGASLNAGSGTVTINSAKAINIGGVISGALTATNAASFAVGNNISTSGAIDIRATGDITVAGTGGIVANASPGLSITLIADKDNDGTGDVKVSNSTAAINTNGGTVTIGGQGFALGASLSAGSGSVTVNSAKAVSIGGNITSGALAATNVDSFAVGGSINASGAIDIRANGDISVAGSLGIYANASPGLSVTLISDRDSDGTGDVKVSNSTAQIVTNGGAVTIGGQGFSLVNRVNTNQAGVVQINSVGNVTIGRDILASAVTVTNAAAFQVRDIKAYVGGIAIVAQGGVTIRDAFTYAGGNFTSQGTTLDARAIDIVSSGGAGHMTLVHSGAITVSGRWEAQTYNVSGGGNMTFVSGSRLVLRVNLASPSTNLFAQTGAGTLRFLSGSFIQVLNTGGPKVPGTYTILTTEGGLTDASTKVFVSPVTAVQVFANSLNIVIS